MNTDHSPDPRSHTRVRRSIMTLLKVYATIATGILILISLTAFQSADQPTRFDEITVGRINVVDSLGRTRVIIAGGLPPRRSELAGLLFINQDGNEAGGYVYSGTRDEGGAIRAGAVLTFDQYRNDQILALSYDQSGDRKRQGLTIQERPDTLSTIVKEFYRAVEGASTPAMRESLMTHYLSIIPRQDIVSPRLFVGRDYSRASLVTLSDPVGRPRLRLQVDSLGEASIAFLDTTGRVVRTITP